MWKVSCEEKKNESKCYVELCIGVDRLPVNLVLHDVALWTWKSWNLITRFLNYMFFKFQYFDVRIQHLKLMSVEIVKVLFWWYVNIKCFLIIFVFFSYKRRRHALKNDGTFGKIKNYKRYEKICLDIFYLYRSSTV